jgi:hypothetical protein
MATVKTRILILSDTHGLRITQGQSGSQARSLFDLAAMPEADVAIHCGDLTFQSTPEEFTAAMSLLRGLPCPLKLVIPGNHDAALDPIYWNQNYPPTDAAAQMKRDWPGLVREQIREAKAAANVHMLEAEGEYVFVLPSGARLAVYASCLTPRYGGWAFQYRSGTHGFAIPEEGIDVVISHGPPYGILDQSWRTSARAGCQELWSAVAKARPKIHCFGHIHEGWGARLLRWPDGGGEASEHDSVLVEDLTSLDQLRPSKRSHRSVSLSPGQPGALNFTPRSQTLFVNAAIMDVRYRPTQLPWLVEVDLPTATEDDVRRAETRSDAGALS